MGLNDVVFNKQQGGLGRALPGSDYISGMLFYSSSLPSGFTTTNNKKQVFAVTDAEALGITTDYMDETQATATITVSAIGVVGDTVTVNVTENTVGGGTTTYTLCTYSQKSSDTSAALLAASIAAAINANSFLTSFNGLAGYSATVATDVVTVTARVGLGISINGVSPVCTVAPGTSTLAVAVTPFAGGAYSKAAIWHYHISEYFRVQPGGNLWVGFYPVPGGTPAFSELQDLQNFATNAGASIRQCLIYNLIPRTAANVATDCAVIQTVCTTLDNLHMPLSVVYAPNISAVSDLSTLPNLGLQSANKVSVNISQDGAAAGAQLYFISGVSITTGGALLGAVSLASVNEDIAWVQKFNMTNGIECDTIAFANGKLLTDTAITTNLLTQLDLYRYIFLRSYVDFTGSYFNDSHCAIAQSSDYAYIENNRTIDKAIRVGRAALLPFLNSPLSFNADGTLTNLTIASLRGALYTAASPMVRAGEISADSITIDPKQPALTTSSVYISFKIVPDGVARNIIVNIGFTTSI